VRGVSPESIEQIAMRRPALPYLLLLMMLVVCFSLAASLDARFQSRHDSHSGDVMTLLLGDGRRMFANHFFVKADAYFHSGFYPSIFDNQENVRTAHIAEDAGAVKGKNTGEEGSFLGEPLDFIEAFERNFMPARHTHLDEGGAQGPEGDLGEDPAGGVREILPWLELSAQLDPHRIETYTVTAYWLRSRMHKASEAEQFLREGLRANPGNPAILYELGRIYSEDKKDPSHARNIWELAVNKLDAKKKLDDQDEFTMMQLTIHLANLEEEAGNYPRAIEWIKRNQQYNHVENDLQKQIDDLELKMKSGKGQDKGK
jgi:hypothetical protein